MQLLYETYENNANMAGVEVAEKATLSLPSHMMANAQIEITLSEEGGFQGAGIVPKENRATLIPVTEKSSGRASGIAPHPLCDMLPYIAKGFGEFIDVDAFEKESDRKKALSDAKKCVEKFQAYIDELEKWAESTESHPKVQAIFRYCKEGTMLRDLIQSGILKVNENGKFIQERIEGNTYDKCLVRFLVYSGFDSNEQSGTWQDSSLFDSFIRYTSVSQEDARTDICYVSGKTSTIAVNHPKGILASSYGAKLVSANDMSGFTFRGRFTLPEQANSVGYEATQKAHNALTWLAKNQGVYFGGRCFVCFHPGGKPVPDVSMNPGGFDDEEEETAYTMPDYQRRIKMALKGYRDKLEIHDKVVIMSLDAATTGRLSITYFNELRGSDYLDRLQNWSESCYWFFPRFDKERKLKWNIETPLTKRIAEYAFGTEQNGIIKVDDRVLREQTQRILNCILNEQPVPRDIVHALVTRASMPQAYSYWNHERVLSTACALIRKTGSEKNLNGEVYKMTLNEESDDRSYLFGRLLAIAEKVERLASPGEDRETNANRMQSAFQQHPMRTWGILQNALVPYYAKLFPGQREKYRKLTSDVASKLKMDDPELNKSLKDIYLLGYYCQRKDLNDKKEEPLKEERA